MKALKPGDRGAYPLQENDFTFGQKGLTKRELFAVMLMQGLVSRGDSWSPRSAAREGLKCADALLEALEPEGDQS